MTLIEVVQSTIARGREDTPTSWTAGPRHGEPADPSALQLAPAIVHGCNAAGAAPGESREKPSERPWHGSC